jgi:single-strand DNA-binding protein
MNLNKVLLIGNLTREPELKYTSNGSAVCELSMAINRKYKSGEEMKQETTFVEVTIWGKQAESSSRYLSKGSPAFIEGRLQLDTWQDKESGKNRSKLRVVAERVQFMGSKSDNQEAPQQASESNDSYQPDGMAGEEYGLNPHPAAKQDYENSKANTTVNNNPEDVPF